MAAKTDQADAGQNQYNDEAREHADRARDQSDQASLHAREARAAADDAQAYSTEIFERLEQLKTLAAGLEDEARNLRQMGRALRTAAPASTE